MLPALLLVAVVAGTGDWLAGVTGVIALGLVMAALPQCRRRWPVLLPVPAVVLLVLLLAANAYLAFGLFFLAILPWALALWSVSRGGEHGGTPLRYRRAR